MAWRLTRAACSGQAWPLIVALAVACGDAPAAPDTSAPDAAGEVTPDTSPEVSAPRKRCELPVGVQVSLPADDARHDAPLEWYYWTGHLQAEDGRWFGFHITVLAAGPAGQALLFAHHSLTRDDGGGYSHGFATGIELQDLPAQGFAFDLDTLEARGVDGRDVLYSELDASKLTLELVDDRGPVARHGTGFQDYGGGITTYYYARPRQTARGTLELDGEILAVTGTVWFDHQWGTLAAPDQSRWDWIAIQLDDGRDLMVVQLPTLDGGVAGFAELTDADCNIEHFGGEDVSFTASSTWLSPHSKCDYPMEWQVTVGDMRFDLSPLTEDQEMLAQPVPYWEGATTVSGSATGRAYVELVGYCH